MRKLSLIIALLFVFGASVSAIRTSQPGPPGGNPPPPESKSVLKYFQDCAQVNYIPKDQDHDDFLRQVGGSCPKLSDKNKSVSDQLTEVSNAQSCISNVSTDKASLKVQLQATLTCVQGKVQASSSSYFVQKKKQPVLHKKLRL